MKIFKKNITLVNIIANLLMQFMTILSGFVLPKIILSYFGSDVNGLVSSLTQFLNYITILEGGVTSVITASLYKPLINGNKEKIDSIITTADSFFKKIGIIYMIYSVILSITYPIIVKTGFSYTYIMILTMILSLNLLIQYMFSLTYKTLLIADKKGYVVSLAQSIILFCNIFFSLIIAKLFSNIHILKLLNGLIFLVQPLIFHYFIKRNYQISKKAKKDNKLIKNRWSGFAINFAAFIHMSTDVVILTIFTNLSTVSVYSVYALVISGLRAIINAVSNAITPTVGQAYAKENLDELNFKMDLFEYITFFTVFLLFVTSTLLITPFVLIYTKGINDANYYQPTFGVILLIAEGMYLIKNPHINLAYSANRFKEITKPAFFEAIINILVSLILVRKFGLLGVAIGTLVAMTYRTIFHISFTKKMIGRKISIFYKKFLIFLSASIIGLIICIKYMLIKEYNIINFLKYGTIYSLLFGIIYIIISLIYFKNELIFLKNYLVKK